MVVAPTTPSLDEIDRVLRAAEHTVYEADIVGNVAHNVLVARVLLHLKDSSVQRFAIGAEHWPGISKLMEEAGEVVQVCGKLLGTYGETQHWNVPDLKARLEEELGDLLAAIHFVTDKCGLDFNRIQAQRERKQALFMKWHAEGDPLPKAGK